MISFPKVGCSSGSILQVNLILWKSQKISEMLGGGIGQLGWLALWNCALQAEI